MEYRLKNFIKKRINKVQNNDKKIFYAGSSSNIVDANQEYNFVKELEKKLRTNNFELVYRPHPNNLPDQFNKTSFEKNSDNVYNVILKCTCLIGVSNTLMFETAILAKKVFGIDFLKYDLHKDAWINSFLSTEDIFSDKNELLKKLNCKDFKTKSINLPDFQIQFSKFLKTEKLI